tara:strand:- start:11163 stop:11297 length:135 start_codon:yes stop_codon:yes gene_type:complete
MPSYFEMVLLNSGMWGGSALAVGFFGAVGWHLGSRLAKKKEKSE